MEVRSKEYSTPRTTHEIDRRVRYAAEHPRQFSSLKEFSNYILTRPGQCKHPARTVIEKRMKEREEKLQSYSRFGYCAVFGHSVRLKPVA